MKKITAFICTVFVILLFASCEKERNQDDYTSEEYALISQDLTLPQVVNDYQLNLGEHYLPEGKTYPKVNIASFGDIQLNNNRATLGRVLFYDETLSLDRNVSCGSCHLPEHTFSDVNQFSEGVNMSGTLQEYDRLTNVNAGTIRAAVNGSPVVGTGSVSAGTWSLSNVTAFDGDIVTVWVDGATEEDEAVTSFIYDGLGDITGVSLYEQHLTIDADEFGTTTNALRQ